MATTTPNYGWTVPTSTDLVKDGATAIETLGDAIDASMNTALGTKKAGMVLLNTTSFSGVASQSLNNVFSATYRNYRILIDVEGAGATTDLHLRLRVGGSDASGANTYRRNVLDVNGASVTANRGDQTFALLGAVDSNDGAPSWLVIDITQPFLANETNWMSINSRNQSNSFLSIVAGYHDVTTSYDGFTIYTNGGTNMTGQVSTYGYNA